MQDGTSKQHYCSFPADDNAAVGSGNVVNDVQFEYNDFGQRTTSYQSHSGAVNTMTTPKVQYAYADGSANTIRPTSITYPDGRVITFDYGAGGGNDDNAGRIFAHVDHRRFLKCPRRRQVRRQSIFWNTFARRFTEGVCRIRRSCRG